MNSLEHEFIAKEKLKDDAYNHIAKCTGVRTILEMSNELAIIVEVAGVKIGLCDDDAFIQLLNNEISEAQKSLKGDKNKFE